MNLQLSMTVAVTLLFTVFVVHQLSVVVAVNNSSGLLGDPSRRTMRQSERCRNVIQRLIQHALLPLSHSNITGSAEISNSCSNLGAEIETCCTEETQNKLNEKHLPDFLPKIQVLTSQLKTTLTAHREQYMDYIKQTITLAKNRTRDVLYNHQVFSDDLQEAVDVLFFNLSTLHSIHTTDTTLEKTVHELFDKLFPALFLSKISTISSMKIRNKENCLMNFRSKVPPHPFGIAPTLLLLQLKKFVISSSAYSTALGVAIEVIDKIGDAQFYSSDCQGAQKGQIFCSLCKGLMDIKPCRSVCLDHARGCMDSVMRLEPLWNSLIYALERFVSTDKLSRALGAFQEIDIQMTDAIAHCTESLHLFLPQVISECDEISDSFNTTYSSTPSTPSTPDAHEMTLVQQSRNVQFKSELIIFIRHLKETKHLFNNIPYNLCAAENHLLNEKRICLNETILKRHRPSHKFSRTISNASEFEQISTKLRFITEILMNSTTVDSVIEPHQTNVRVISKLRLKRSYSKHRRSMDRIDTSDDEEMASGVVSGSGSIEDEASGMESETTTIKVADPIVELTTIPHISQGWQSHHYSTTTSTSNSEQCTSLKTPFLASVVISLISTLIIRLC